MIISQCIENFINNSQISTLFKFRFIQKITYIFHQKLLQDHLQFCTMIPIQEPTDHERKIQYDTCIHTHIHTYIILVTEYILHTQNKVIVRSD